MDMQTQDLALAPPTLPKGGGAIQSIGSGWGAVGATGGASLDIPLPISPGRSLAPALSLAYSSQAGRSTFGQGWSVGIPSFARRSNKGVPAYLDDDPIVAPNGDVLVPECDADGQPVIREVSTFRGTALGETCRVLRYFPRTEGGGSRIESWRAPSGWFWMLHDADGSVHIFGKTAKTVSTLGDEERIAQWWLEESVAANGEKMRYEYAHEDGAGLPDEDGTSRDQASQVYLQRVLYGNERGDWVPDLLRMDAERTWLFELWLDYGERPTALAEKPPYAPANPWLVRKDPFSSFAYGFEVRTLRLCRQVLMFHRFPELGPDPVLVRRLLLEYDEGEQVSYLVAAHSMAYDAQGAVAYSPPLEFRYTRFAPPETASFDEFPALATPEGSLPGLNDGSRYQLVDLYGEGLAGVLHPARGGWYYREPMRGPDGGDEVVYDDWQLLPKRPTAQPGAEGRMALADLTGDGKLEWLVTRPGAGGYFTLSSDRCWEQFVPFASLPTEFLGSRGQLADLTGAGLSDFAVIGTRSVRWYANARANGFAPPIEVPHDLDLLPGEGDGKGVLVGFGDLLGSGQQHLFRIRHDEVSVWPNLGRGRFGARIAFASLPFGPAAFDAARVRLADLDGSGATDLIYLESEHALVFMNLSGHGFAEPVAVAWPEGVRYDRLCEVSTADLQGMGCSSLVLSVPHMSPRHWRCDFGRRVKPHMLEATNNNMGAQGEVDYRSSAQEWLDEKKAKHDSGRPAISALPFPVQVVTAQRQIDEVTGQHLAQRFRYRGGYYDGYEREFRGFAQLVQQDTEMPVEGMEAEDGFTAPVVTTTWFHVGRLDTPEDQDFDGSDPDMPRLGATLCSRYDAETGEDTIGDTWSEDMSRQFARALSGSVRRMEVHGLDVEGSPPYSVGQQRYLLRVWTDPTGQDRDAVIQPFVLEEVACDYERLPGDPRITHTLGLRWDARGAPTHAAVVYYARRKGDPPFEDEYPRRWWEDSQDEAQASYYVSETLAEWIHADDPQWWRSQLPYRSRANAMVIPDSGLRPADICYERFIDPQGPLGANRQRTLAQLSVQRYQGCADGEASFAALPDYMEAAELDDAALQAYADVMTPTERDAKLVEVGYHRMPSFFPDDEGAILWSVQRGFATFDTLEAFHRVTAYRLTRELGETRAEYDPHGLFTARVIQPDGCTTMTDYDYRSLLPWRIVDPNENTQEAAYDAFGRVVATSFYGTEMGEEIGFAPIAEYERRFELPDDALAAPGEAIQDAATVSFYAPFAWMGQVPAGVLDDAVGTMGRWTLPGGYLRASARWRLAAGDTPPAAGVLEGKRHPPHAAVLLADRYPGDPERQIRRSIADSDGFGRTIQQKQFVEPGEAYATTEDGRLELDSEGQPLKAHSDTRWRVSERVEYNNKGLPVRTYRPYFADTHHYIRDDAFRQFGYCDRQYYDPLGRPTVTWTAAGWMRRQTYWPWYTIAEDENDTAEEVLQGRATRISG